MPERHLGLTTVGEIEGFEERLNVHGDIAEKHLELDKILDIAKSAPPIEMPDRKEEIEVRIDQEQKLLVGIIRDPAFQFYYPENLESLEREGAKLVEFDSMQDKEIKPVDLLYIAGGFPEVYADKISQNRSFCESIRHYAEKGLPIYGECGAVIYLGRNLIYNGNKYEMCGVFPLNFEFSRKPSGHGYTAVRVDHENPFFPKGVTLKGHEFHYSLVSNWKSAPHQTAFTMDKGIGLDGKRDGIFVKNVFATYTHIHASGERDWATCLIETARRRRFSELL
jgi:cobyrinic acid a,c-diamide synthase